MLFLVSDESTPPETNVPAGISLDWSLGGSPACAGVLCGAALEKASGSNVAQKTNARSEARALFCISDVRDFIE
jgi:hypothetical protein